MFTYRPIRLFTATLLSCLGMGALCGAPTMAQAQVTTLTVASWAGPNHAINTGGWAKVASMIEERSGGTLKLNVTFPPVNPKVMFDRVEEAISDIAWGFNGYTPGRFTTYKLVELPGLGVGAEAASVAYWRTHKKYLEKANEYRAVKLLALFAQPPSVLHTSKPINSLADINGLKIRVGGGVQAEVAQRLGIVGIQAPVADAYQMIKDGVVDGTFFPTETAISFKLNEVAGHQFALKDGLFGAAYFIVMNKKKYDSLSDEHKRVIDEISGELMSATFGRAWDDAEKQAIAASPASKEGGYHVAEPELEKQIMKLLQPIDALYVQEVDDKGIDGEAALGYLRSEAHALAAGQPKLQ